MRLVWDKTGERKYETGCDRGVLYPQASNGEYQDGVTWNGLTAVTESPSGAEASPQYADNIKYLNLRSREEFGATIEAFTAPDEFGQCDGTAEPSPGVYIGQQSRTSFGLSYRTLIGNDVEGSDHGYKIHLVWGADAAPSEKAYSTVNDSPEPTGLSWELTTTPVNVGVIDGVEYKPTASLTVDSTKVDADSLKDLEDAIYGTSGGDPRLPLPGEVIEMFSGTLSEVETVPPSYNASTDTVTIPSVTGVIYKRNGSTVTGSFTITQDTVITAVPAPGYRFTETSDTDFSINYS